MRKVAGEHPFCILIYMNSYMFHICFILFILLSYLIFDFVCLTLSSADTHGIAKYARTYIRYTHIHAHTQKKEVERLGKTSRKNQNKEKRGGVRKERKKKKKERTKRKGGKRRRKMRIKWGERKKERTKRKSEGDGFRGVEERDY